MNRKQPEYIRLYQELRNDIVKNRYPYGSRMPSKRMLAEEQGVSVITVEHAYDLLCEEGYVEGRQRSGYFVIYRDADFPGTRPVPGTHPFPAAHPFPEKTVPVAENQPLPASSGHADSRFPFSVLAGVMRRVLQDYGEDILVRSPNQGCMEFREAICAYLDRSRRIRVQPDQIVIGSGAEYLYGIIAQMFRTRYVFALEEPSYYKIRQVYQAFGVRYEMLRLGPEGIYSEELQRSRAGVLHVTPFHSYPSEITASASKKYEYLRWVTQRGGYLIEDNYDSELTVSRKAEEPLFSMSENENVIYLNTFSKTIAPSMRVGYMVLPGPLAEEFQETLGFYACTVPVFEQLVISELLQSGDYERQINRIRRRKRKS